MNRLPIIIVSFLVFVPFNAIAQNIPPGNEPGAQASRFQDTSEQEKNRVSKKKVKAPDIEIAKEKEKAPQPPAGPSFILQSVEVTDSTIFKPADFRAAYESYIGKQVTFKDLEDIAEKIKTEYKKRGYLTTTTYIPEQNISSGKVEIRVSEGKMGSLKVEGNKWFASSLIEKYIHVKKNEVLNIFRMGRDMLRLNQNSDMEVRAVISPGKEPGTTDIVLKVDDHIPYHAGVSFDDQGTRLVGKDRTSLSFRSTNLLGFNDSAFANTLMSASSTGEFVSYAIPIDTYGTRACFDYTAFSMKLGKEYKRFDITGTTQIYTPHISGEIYLSEDFQAGVDTGIEIKSIKKKVAWKTTTNDQLRQPYVDFDLAKMDTIFGGGQTAFSPRFSFGTANFLGASSLNHPSESRPDTGGFFFRYEQTVKRIQKMFFDSYVSVRSQFQTASTTLPSSEQIQLGGANTVRGYPEGEYLADIGATLNVEWVFPCYIIPKEIKLPYAKAPLREQLQPVIFMDMAGGKIKKLAPGERPDRFLMGVGGGLRFSFNRNLFLRLDWAERVGDRPTQGQGPSNFYVTLQCEL